MNKLLLLKAFDDFLAKVDPAYRKYHRIADKMAPEVRKQFLESIAKIQKGINLKELEKALKIGDFVKAENLVDWKALNKTLTEINKTLTKVFKESVSHAEDTYLKNVGITQTLKLPNHKAEKWIQTNGAKLVTQVGDETRIAIRELILRGQQGKVSPSKTASDIKKLIGLDDRRAQAVENFKRKLVESGKYKAEKVDRYYQRKLKERAEMIARNETITAAKEGAHEILEEAIGKGYLNEKEWQRRFIVTPDDRLCPRCASQGGTVVGLKESYPWGNTPHIHILCRCDELIERKDIKPESLEVETFEAKTSGEALSDYQNYAYKDINNNLRKGTLDAQGKEYVNKIDKLMNKQTSKDIYAYRGDGAALSARLFENKNLQINASIDDFNSIDRANKELRKLKGTIFQDNAFLSTSKDKQVALNNFVSGSYDVDKRGGSGLVEIHGKTKSLNVDSFTGMGAKESEYLLPRGTKLKIENVFIEPHPDGSRLYIRWITRIIK